MQRTLAVGYWYRQCTVVGFIVTPVPSGCEWNTVLPRSVCGFQQEAAAMYIGSNSVCPINTSNDHVGKLHITLLPLSVCQLMDKHRPVHYLWEIVWHL